MLDPLTNPVFTKKNLDKSKKKYFHTLLFLITATIGIGYLTFPYACSQIGLIPTLIIINFAGILSLYSAFLIIRVYNLKRIESYSILIYTILGRNHYYISLCVLSFRIFTITTLYVFFSSQMISYIFLYFNIEISFVYRLMINASVSLIGFFLAIFKYKKWFYFGLLGIFFSFYLIIVFIIQIKSNAENIKYEDISYFILYNEKDEIFNFKLFTVFGTAFFAFSIHDFFLTILRLISNLSDYHNYSVKSRSNYLPFILYTSITILGYISYGNKYVPSLIIKPVKFDNKEFKINYLMIIAIFGLFVNIIINIGARIKSNRDTFVVIFKKDIGYWENNFVKPPKGKINYLICLGFSILSFLFAVFIDDKNIMSVINLLTSVFAPYYAFFLPVQMNLKLKKDLKISNGERIWLIFYAVLGSVFMTFCWFCSILYFPDFLI